MYFIYIYVHTYVCGSKGRYGERMTCGSFGVPVRKLRYIVKKVLLFFVEIKIDV